MRSFDFRSRSLSVLANPLLWRFSGLLPFTATFRVNERLCNQSVTEIIYLTPINIHMNMKNKLLYTKFSIRWVFLTLTVMSVAIIYALTQSI